MRIISQCRKCGHVEDAEDYDPHQKVVEIVGKQYGLCETCAVLPAAELVAWAAGELKGKIAQDMLDVPPLSTKEEK